MFPGTMSDHGDYIPTMLVDNTRSGPACDKCDRPVEGLFYTAPDGRVLCRRCERA